MVGVNSVPIYQIDYDWTRRTNLRSGVFLEGMIAGYRRTYDYSRVSRAFSDCLIFEVKDLFHCLLAMPNQFLNFLTVTMHFSPCRLKEL